MDEGSPEEAAIALVMIQARVARASGVTRSGRRDTRTGISSWQQSWGGGGAGSFGNRWQWWLTILAGRRAQNMEHWHAPGHSLNLCRSVWFVGLFSRVDLASVARARGWLPGVEAQVLGLVRRPLFVWFVRTVRSAGGFCGTPYSLSLGSIRSGLAGEEDAVSQIST